MEVNKYNPRLKRLKNIGHTTNANTLAITPQPFTRIVEIRPLRDEVGLLDSSEKLLMKFVDAGNTEFSPNTIVRMGVQEDREDAFPVYIGQAVYGPWQRSTLDDQRNTSKNGNLKFYYNWPDSLPQLPFAFGSVLFVEVNQPAQIDWTPTDPANSEFAIDLEFVTIAEARARGYNV